ncbi:MAG: tRNA pseudouridine(38-40) synthase TruA [bacterium]|nr:tRNA pseudouridine(38-40) synthase TruA [bacterium]
MISEDIKATPGSSNQVIDSNPASADNGNRAFVYKLVIAYDGTAFSGFQSQANPKLLPTIQDIVEQKLSWVFACPISIRVSGRTDAGVHALGQVLSFRTTVKRKPEILLNALKKLLPNTIEVLSVTLESERFHARFTARAREYEYLIKDNSDVDPFFRDRILYVKHKLNIEAMRQGASYLLGSHNFASFGSQVPKDEPTVRRMLSITFAEDYVTGPGPFARVGRLIILRIKANAFLRRMVRMICGALIKVGSGQWPPEKIGEVLEKADPRFCPPPASPGGLYFKNVDFTQD